MKIHSTVIFYVVLLTWNLVSRFEGGT